MKNSLLAESRLVYRAIEQQINNGALELTDERKWIEWSFGLTMKTWVDIEKMAADHRFSDQDEEIDFYKTMKPAFTGLIEYFTLLYKFVVFQPDDPEERSPYWEAELSNCWDSIVLYESGCLYYEKQEDRHKHFLQQNNQQPLIFGLSLSQFNYTATSYSYLLGRLHAMNRYLKYLQAQC
jgi:hypothetical protein